MTPLPRNLVLVLLVCAAAHALAQTDGSPPPKPPTPPPATATGLLAQCVANLPREPLALIGALTVRRQRGVIVAEYPYRLTLDWGAVPARAQCDLADAAGRVIERLTLVRRDGRATLELRAGPDLALQPAPSLAGRVRGTDMTWLDLTLDFLWWTDARLDGEDTVRGRLCDVVVAAPPAPVPGCTGVRLWLDRDLRFLLRAEQLDPQGRPSRRMGIRSLRKFKERWLIGEMEIESIGSDFRTRLRVDDVQTP